MKRSRSIELALMGTVPLLLAGCSHAHQDTALLYEDLQQCISDGKVPAVTCEEGYERALLAEQQAPRYATQSSCEAQYGDHCRVIHDGGHSWFIPAAVGFLIGRATAPQTPYYGYSSGWSSYHGGWHGPAGWTGQPVYRARGDRGQWQTLSGQRFGWGARGPAAHSVAETVSRGGFGRTAAARGSWGG